ncbi:SIR2 family protein [Bacillus cereus]|nr:SIR2 family protein [Bacillus cereus]
MINIEELLAEHLKKISTAPFLFIGSGFSRRYLNLPNWDGLLEQFSELVPRSYDYYVSTANKELPEVARLIAQDFHPIWWDDDKYLTSREKFKGKINTIESPLKIEIAQYLRDITYEYGKNENNDREIDALKQVVIDGIITTNWDTFLEQVFVDSDIKAYIGQKELLFSQPFEVNELYKIHGCSTNHESLVLTSNDYKLFNQKNPYLAAKLLTIFIEHPVIFLGYSISDPNIQQILDSITACLDQENIDKLKDRLIFVERAAGATDAFESSSFTTSNRVTIPITKIKTDNYELVYKALSKNKRKFSMKTMRQIKSQIYELVKTNDPSGKVAVIDGENLNAADIEFVIGVGVTKAAEQLRAARDEMLDTGYLNSIGYQSIPQIDIYKEILADPPSYDYDALISQTLPQLLGTNHRLPVFKFIKECGIETEELPVQLKRKLGKKLTMNYFLTQSQRDIKKSQLRLYNNIPETIEGYADFTKALQCIPHLGADGINLDELHHLLKQHIDKLDADTPASMELKRLIRIYDWLKYGKSLLPPATKIKLQRRQGQATLKK